MMAELPAFTHDRDKARDASFTSRGVLDTCPSPSHGDLGYTVRTTSPRPGNRNSAAQAAPPQVRRRCMAGVRLMVNASLLLASNESPVYVKDQLGHSSIKVTVDRYRPSCARDQQECRRPQPTRESSGRWRRKRKKTGAGGGS